jgi:hypothetical protein
VVVVDSLDVVVDEVGVEEEAEDGVEEEVLFCFLLSQLDEAFCLFHGTTLLIPISI